MIGTENQNIKNYSTLIQNNRDNSDIFLLVMIDNISEIRSTDIKERCCQCYFVVWKQLKEACIRLEETMKNYYKNVVIIPENTNANEFRNTSPNKSDWVKVKSSKYASYYWFNEKTGESSWEDPYTIKKGGQKRNTKEGVITKRRKMSVNESTKMGHQKSV